LLRFEINFRTIECVRFDIEKKTNIEAFASLHFEIVPRSVTLHFEPFRFWLQIRGDIRNRKTSRGVGDTPIWQVEESPTLSLAEFSFQHSKADSLTPSRRVGESQTPRVGEFQTPRLVFHITNIFAVPLTELPATLRFAIC
jgi:hypothetical protein